MSEPGWYKFYDDKVPRTINQPEHIVDKYAESNPRKVIFLCCGRKMNYRQLADNINNFASSLLSFGIKKGDRICFLLPNLFQFPIVHLSILKVGAISVPLNPLLTTHEIEKHIKLCTARILITIDTCYDKIEKIKETTSIERVIVTQITDYFSFVKKIGYYFKYGNSQKLIDYNGSYSFTELNKMANSVTKFPDLSMSDDAMLLSTGGLTGTLKLATMTHSSLMSNAEQVQLWNLQFRKKKDTMLGALPFFHSFGITLGLHYCLLSGIRLVFMPKYSGQKAITAIKRYKINYFPGVPAMFSSITKVDKKDLKSLYFCLSGGYKLNRELQKEFEKNTGVRIIESYGLTEACPAAISNPLTNNSKTGSVGIPLPSTQAKIINPVTKEEILNGQEGELIIKGPQVMKGYWKNPKETESTIRDGWLHTGDIAKTDNNKFFYITGRLKDLIIYGGFNIFPLEVENVLLKHPKIKDVRVSGVEDKKYGELVKASVVLNYGFDMNAGELKDFCKKYLAWYKIPRKLEFLPELSKKRIIH